MKYSISFLLIFLVQHSYAQINLDRFIFVCDSLLNYGVSRPMIPGGTISIVSSDSIYYTKGFGYSDYSKKTKVKADSTLFQLGSIGKLITAIGVLQQVENHKIKLDQHVNELLTEFKVDTTFGRITPFHLLTHSAGLNDQIIGYMARSESEIELLGDHLGENFPTSFQAAGKSINYSNYSYALAGHLIEQVTGTEFKTYNESEIFQRLNMSNTSFTLPDSYRVSNIHAKGYKWRDTFEEQSIYPRHAIPAGSLISTSTDMAKLMQALLKQDSSLLNKNSFRLLLTQQFSNHRKLPGYSLGMEIQNYGGYMAIGKGGQVPGFLSVLILFPQDDIGLFLSVNTETDNFFDLFFKTLKGEFFPIKESPVSNITSININEYAGHYSNERTNHDTFEEFFMLYNGHVELLERGNNLLIYENNNWQNYQPFGNDIFQNQKDSSKYIVFSRNASGEITEMFKSVSIGGYQVPASYKKLNWFERPRFMNDEYPILLLIFPIYLLLVIATWVVPLITRHKLLFLIKYQLPFYYHAVSILFLGLFVWNIVGFFIPLLRNREDLLFGIDPSLAGISYFNWAMALVAIVLLVLSLKIWYAKIGHWVIRVFYTLYSLIAISYVYILHKWHFLTIL